MSGNLVTTTPKSSIQALAFQGIMVYACYSQIHGILCKKFGDEFGLLFAEPVENQASGEIDWYTPVQGKPKRLSALPEEERLEVCRAIQNMGREIEKYANELINTNYPLNVTRGNILKLSLCYPNENERDECIWMVGEQPVITCWGFGPGTPGVEGKNLTRILRDRPAPRPAQAAAAPESPMQRQMSFAWLWWLLPLLALLLLLALLFGGIGGKPALSGLTLFNVPRPDFMRAPESGGDPKPVEDEIARLEKELRDKADQCQPEKKPLPQASPKAEEPLVIPPDSQGMSFLKGVWRCDTGLANSRTNEPVRVIFEFDENGDGTASTYEKNDVCGGKTHAEMRNGVLHIDVDEQICQKSKKTYAKISIDCRSGASAAECLGEHAGGGGWNAEFHKVR